MVIYTFPFHIIMPQTNLWFILRTRSYPDLYPLIGPPIRLLAFYRRRILIPGFIRQNPMLAVQDVPHSFPVGGAGRDFLFTQDKIQRQSYTSLLFLERIHENKSSPYRSDRWRLNNVDSSILTLIIRAQQSIENYGLPTTADLTSTCTLTEVNDLKAS